MTEPIANRVRDLVGQDELGKAAELLAASPGLAALPRNELVTWRAELHELTTANRRGEIDRNEYVRSKKRLAFALLDLVDSALASSAPAPSSPPPQGSREHHARRIFLSYNHGDQATAQALASELRAAGHEITIDAQAMRPGQQIRDFVRAAIQGTELTLSVVSRASLLSGWVALESLISLTDLQLWNEREFIAGYLDEQLFDPATRLALTAEIDEKIAQLDALARQHEAARVDSNDLNDERTRLYDLRHGLGAILQHLRGSLCLDLRAASRQASIARIVDALRAERSR